MARPVGPRGEGRSRVCTAALELFAEHGVSGTSLQMIADHLGVTKAAVYYQFKAKEDIVRAVMEPAFDTMQAVVGEAQQAATGEDALDWVVTGLVDLMIDQRELVATLFRDPEVQSLIESDEEYQQLTGALLEIMVGDTGSPRRRVAASMFGAGLAHVAMDPLLADLDPAVLRDELLYLGHTLFAVS